MSNFCELGRAVIETEGAAIQALKSRVNNSFAMACEHILHCNGRIVVLGMGKSGHIASKIAATLASTGTPAFYVHPGEAGHGDAGMITSQDVVLALSNSGETSEILTLLSLIKRLGVPLITLTGNPLSTLALAANVNLDVSVEKEACPLGLAPTSSTTATLVMGDALAIALLNARGFTKEDFALSHPSGALGRRLLLCVSELMHTGEKLPTVPSHSTVSDALVEMTKKGFGLTAVLDPEGFLCGIYTDGDLRRTLDKGLHPSTTQISHVMTTQCKTVTSHTLAVETLTLMETHKITALLVVDATNDKKLIGVVHLHDLLRSGVL